MSMFGESGFDCNAPENNEANVVPGGEYDVVLVKYEKRESKNKPGAFYLWLDFQITTGEFQNKHLFHMMNLWSLSPDAVKIAKTELSALGRAVNVLTPKDPSEFVAKPLRVKVTVTNDDGDFGQQNRVRKFMPRNALAQPAVKSIQQPAAERAPDSIGSEANPFA